MATASVKHLYTGSNTGVLYTDRRDFYLNPTTFSELFKSEVPFTTLARKNRKTGLKDPVFKMFQFENTFMRRYIRNNGSSVTIAAASSGASAESGAVTIDGVTGYGSHSTIDSSFVHNIYEVWDSGLTTKRGVCILTDDTSGTTAKFRNLGTTAISTVDNDYFIHISNAQEDGSEAPDAYSSELEVVWNQCQNFKNPLELKGAILDAALRGDSNELLRLRAEKFKQHKVDIEGAFMRGKAPLGTNLGGADTFTDLDALVGDNSDIIRTTYGIIPAIEDYGSSSGDYQNIWTYPKATMKYADFVDMSEKMFQYYPPDDMLYAISGRGALSFWSKMEYARGVKSNWTVQISEMKKDRMGFNVQYLETPHGVLALTKSDALRFEYNDYMVVPDDRYLSYHEFKPSVFKQNVKTDNDYEGQKDLYKSNVGLGLTHIKTHSLVKLT